MSCNVCPRFSRCEFCYMTFYLNPVHPFILSLHTSSFEAYTPLKKKVCFLDTPYHLSKV